MQQGKIRMINQVNLNNNNVIQKEIEEIKNLIKNNNKFIIVKKAGNFRAHYEILNRLGKSSYSIVNKIKSKVNNQLKAIKRMDKKKIRNNFKRNYFRIPKEQEIDEYITPYINNMKILEGVNNINIMKIYEYFHTKMS